MYSAADQAISDDSITTAETFAGYAAVAVAVDNAALYHAAADTALQISRALQSRAVIEQAKGIIMTRQRCTADEAFHLLARTSQHRNQKLRDIAAWAKSRSSSRRSAGKVGDRSRRHHRTEVRDPMSRWSEGTSRRFSQGLSRKPTVHRDSCARRGRSSRTPGYGEGGRGGNFGAGGQPWCDQSVRCVRSERRTNA
jgi:hypothetical protein